MQDWRRHRCRKIWMSFTPVLGLFLYHSHSRRRVSDRTPSGCVERRTLWPVRAWSMMHGFCVHLKRHYWRLILYWFHYNLICMGG